MTTTTRTKTTRSICWLPSGARGSWGEWDSFTRREGDRQITEKTWPIFGRLAYRVTTAGPR